MLWRQVCSCRHNTEYLGLILKSSVCQHFYVSDHARVPANLSRHFRSRSPSQMAGYFDAWRPGEGQVAIEEGYVELS